MQFVHDHEKNMLYKNPLKGLFLFCLLLLLSATTYADMLISPTRVLIDDTNRSASMVLRNSSTGSRTYRLSWEDKRAKNNGGYTDVTEDEDWPFSARNMLRFSPRQITVGPGENQTVRFGWRPPADLPSGEYRSHILLQVIPDISEPTAAMDMDTQQEGVGVQVFMQMSFSIPVVVRHNTDTPQISIQEIKPVPLREGERLGLELTFNRSGVASSYGRVLVEMQLDDESAVELIGEYGELSIWPEVENRKITIPLRDSTIPEGALIRIAYEGLNEYRGIIWAEKVFKAR